MSVARALLERVTSPTAAAALLAYTADPDEWPRRDATIAASLTAATVRSLATSRRIPPVAVVVVVNSMKDPDQLDALAADAALPAWVRNAVAANPATAYRTLATLAARGRGQAATVAKARLARDFGPSTAPERVREASDPATGPDRLAALASDTMLWRGLAANPSTPSAVLAARAAEVRNATTLALLAAAGGLPAEMQVPLIAKAVAGGPRYGEEVARAVIGRPDVTEAALQALADSELATNILWFPATRGLLPAHLLAEWAETRRDTLATVIVSATNLPTGSALQALGWAQHSDIERLLANPALPLTAAFDAAGDDEGRWLSLAARPDLTETAALSLYRRARAETERPDGTAAGRFTARRVLDVLGGNRHLPPGVYREMSAAAAGIDGQRTVDEPRLAYILARNPAAPPDVVAAIRLGWWHKGSSHETAFAARFLQTALGDDLAAWETCAALLENWDGPLGELVDAVRGLTA